MIKPYKLSESSSLKSTLINNFLENYNFYTSNNLTSIMIHSETSDALLKFMSGSIQTLLFLLDSSSGSFVIRNERITIIEASNSNNMFIGAKKVIANSLNIIDNFNYKHVNQWKLLIRETFNEEPKGWTNNSISQCGGLFMLGGYGKFAGGEVYKEFKKLPPHSVIKINANYHFIDAWLGELGYMIADIGRDGKMEFLWTEKHDYSKSSSATNVCGNRYPENKLTSSIEVIIPHGDENFKIGFGSTLDSDAKENSFGISFFEIYIK